MKEHDPLKIEKKWSTSTLRAKTGKQKEYNPLVIEKKWQLAWEKKKTGQARYSGSAKKKKFYALIEFPYPSGQGLHVGHIRSNTAMDIIARKRRAEGYEVLYPIGWDAFGLPTENFAIKTGVSPEKVTKQNTDTFRRQLKSIGFSFDWSREVNTTDPVYYKWTQWIFLRLLEHGLAYKAKMAINWCPKDKIGLANEEVVNGCCERCGTPVEKREKEQWMLRITAYADRLDKDLDKVDYLEKIKLQQRNWIGKSEGAEIEFEIRYSQGGAREKIKVFTTRPDTLFGVTYVVLSPEHDLVKNLKNQISNWNEVEKYIRESKEKTEIDRTSETKEKTGVELKGIKAINPANGEEILVWVADYVLATYGTGAVMAVPAHDERDFQFAKKYGLPIREVVIPNIVDRRHPPVSGKKVVERKNVHAIVRNPRTGKYLGLVWEKFPWTTFPMGGVEEGEDVVAAAKREVLEETGFTNLRHIRTLPGQVRAEYFAAHKDQNRVSYTTAVLFELTDETRIEIDPEEAAAHHIVWLSEDELDYEHMTHAEVGHWKEKMVGEKAFVEDGFLVDSGRFDGMESEMAKKEITKLVDGKWVTKYKLRDWVFSRQRYWGEPIPVVHCEKCAINNPAGLGIVPLRDKDLPLKLPKVKKYQPTDTGESPLAAISSWVKTKCPKCGGPARRETDTMPQWAGSSWYFMRYCDPANDKKLADPKKLAYWMPVDWYNGGMEHTTLHLLYSRFWNKFLFDIGVSPVSEPYKKRTSHGMILASNGEKMSKSRGNVVNPDDIVKRYGADTLRVYEMFMGPFDQAINWSEENIIGARRFLEKVWKLSVKLDAKTTKAESAFEALLHKTIKKVSEDIEKMSFNTAVSSMMILAGEMEKLEVIQFSAYKILLKLLSPFAPHITEELWQSIGGKTFLADEPWSKADPKKMKETSVTIVVQVNGKVRASMSAPSGLAESEIWERAGRLPEVGKWLEGKEVKKIIHIPDRLINIVVA